jgi:hypothetical protein
LTPACGLTNLSIASVFGDGLAKGARVPRKGEATAANAKKGTLMNLRPWCCAAIVGLTAGIFFGLSSNSWSQVNVALNKPAINGSGSWNGGVVGVGAPFNGGQFPASRTTDGNTSEPDNGALSYWLGRQGTAPEFFTLDLG